MTAQVFIIVLAAALMHATWNAVVKGAADRTITFGLVSAGHTLPALAAVFFLPLPDLAMIPYIIASTVIHWGYYYLLNMSYRVGDLSLVYPIARGSTPLLVAIPAFLFLGEELSLEGWAGLLLISGGIMILSFRPSSTGRPRLAILLALGTAITIAAYSLLDGLGVRISDKAFSYIAWLFVAEGLIVFYIFSTRMERLRALSRKQILIGLSGGVLSALAYALALYAKTLAPLGMVSALRETSVIFAALIGLFWFGEGPARPRLIAAVIVSTGIIMLAMS
jgi:drug/metabolite transporter (DMT)-like permease